MMNYGDIMTKMRYYVFLANSSLTMELYQLMNQVDIDSTLVPTPREADHCCGVCITYSDSDKTEEIKEIAKDNSIEIDQFWVTEIKDNPNRFKFC